MRRPAGLGSLLAHIGVLPFVFFALFPFYFMVVTSLKQDAELYDLTAVPFLIRRGAVLEHYAFLFR
jgi:multiple sugar transport system permease protein